MPRSWRNRAQRYRRAVLFCWWSHQRLIGVFERIRAGSMPIDPQIDVVHSLKLERESILARLPHNLRTLGKLLKQARKDFAAYQRTRTTSGRGKMQRTRCRNLRKAIRLMEELSPRTELLDAMTEEFARPAASRARSGKASQPERPIRCRARTANARRQGVARQDGRGARHAGRSAETAPRHPPPPARSISNSAAIWPRGICGWSCPSPRNIAAAGCRSPT